MKYVKKKSVKNILLMTLIIALIALAAAFNIFESTLDKARTIIDEDELYEVAFDTIDNAKYYQIEVYDENENKIYKTTADKTSIKINTNKLNYKSIYKMNVTAYDSKGNAISDLKEYEFTYIEPSFNEDSSIILKDENHELTIEGDISKSKYSVVVIKDDKVLETIELKTNYFSLNKEYFAGEETIITLEIRKGKKVVNEIKLYSNINPVTEVVLANSEIISSKQDISIDVQEVENAKELYAELYKDDKLIKTENVVDNKVTFAKNLFAYGSSYKVNVVGKNENYEKNAEATISLISSGRDAFLALAAEQVGAKDGSKYWGWFGYTYTVPWCCMFISWLANETGYLVNEEIPKFINVGQGIRYFQSRDAYKSGSETPNPGDIIFFDWWADGRTDHVGIVEYVEDGIVHTIEGNSDDECKRKTYKVGHKEIAGYGVPNYDNN